MTYKVLIEETAASDARDYATYLKVDQLAPEAASRWLNELETAVLQRAELPRRFRIIDEQAHFEIELRQFLHYSHRVIYHVNEATKTVHVLRIYHAHRDALGPTELEQPPK